MIDDVLIIGAGQAGLATAYVLKQAGLRFQILEASERAAGSWPTYYDSLKLFSTARFSSLPGLTFPGDPERYPLRDEVIDYLETYAKKYAFPIRFKARVTSVRRARDYFQVITQKGDVFQAKAVIVASGSFHQPHRPDFVGLDQFAGKLLHSSEYRRPSDVQGETIAIIGAGNSAAQIAYELSADHQVMLISNTPPKFMAQRPLGKDVHFWLRPTGLDTLPLGQWFNWRLTEPILDPGIYRQAFKQGKIQRFPMFDSIHGEGLLWGDTLRRVDSLILATGFVPRPTYLQGLQGLSAQEASVQRGGLSQQVDGLYFVGFSWQRSHASATLRGVGADARYVVNHLQRYLQKAATAETDQGVRVS